jgi:hypothetical protein
VAPRGAAVFFRRVADAFVFRLRCLGGGSELTSS